VSAELATVAIGRLPATGAWVGIEPAAGGWRLVFGEGDDTFRVHAPADGQRDLVLAAVGAYVEDLLGDPPPEIEATHEEIAAAVRWLMETETDPGRRRRLRDALDAVEDGLAVDELIGRLLAADPRDANEPADWVDRLERAYAAVRRG
jgi:hypothetical protein